MRIKQICMMVLLALGVAPWANAQTFDKLWKQVDQAEQKSLVEYHSYRLLLRNNRA